MKKLHNISMHCKIVIDPIPHVSLRVLQDTSFFNAIPYVSLGVIHREMYQGQALVGNLQ